MKFEYQDRIDDYLHGRMSQEEQVAFEKEIGANPEIEDQLQFTKKVSDIMSSRSEKLKKIKEWQADSVPSVAHKPGKQIIYWLSGIAAMFVVGFFLFQTLYNAPSAQTSLIFPGLKEYIYRAGTDNKDIATMVSQKRFDEALASVNERSAKLSRDSLQMMQDSTLDDKMKEYNQLLIQNERDEYLWLKAWILIGQNNNEQASVILKELRSSDGEYHQASDSILKIINQ